MLHAVFNDNIKMFLMPRLRLKQPPLHHHVVRSMRLQKYVCMRKHITTYKYVYLYLCIYLHLFWFTPTNFAYKIYNFEGVQQQPHC